MHFPEPSVNSPVDQWLRESAAWLLRYEKIRPNLPYGYGQDKTPWAALSTMLGLSIETIRRWVDVPLPDTRHPMYLMTRNSGRPGARYRVRYAYALALYGFLHGYRERGDFRGNRSLATMSALGLDAVKLEPLLDLSANAIRSNLRHLRENQPGLEWFALALELILLHQLQPPPFFHNGKWLMGWWETGA